MQEPLLEPATETAVPPASAKVLGIDKISRVQVNVLIEKSWNRRLFVGFVPVLVCAGGEGVIVRSFIWMSHFAFQHRPGKRKVKPPRYGTQNWYFGGYYQRKTHRE